MKAKIKSIFIDIISGIVGFVLIDTISKHIFFDYIYTTTLSAIIFILIGILRGSDKEFQVYPKVLFINIITVFSILLVPPPKILFLPIILTAIIFSFFGLLIRIKLLLDKKNMPIAFGVSSILILFIISFSLYPRFISNTFTTNMHQLAAEFEFMSFDGDSLKLSELKNNVILLDFWESGCAPCIAAMPKLEKLYLKYKNHPNVKILCVDVGWKSLEIEKKFVLKKGYQLPFVYDSESKNEQRLGFSGAGFLIIIDKKNNIRFLHNGYNSAEDYVGSITSHIEQLLSES